MSCEAPNKTCDGHAQTCGFSPHGAPRMKNKKKRKTRIAQGFSTEGSNAVDIFRMPSDDKARRDNEEKDGGENLLNPPTLVGEQASVQHCLCKYHFRRTKKWFLHSWVSFRSLCWSYSTLCWLSFWLDGDCSRTFCGLSVHCCTPRLLPLRWTIARHVRRSTFLGSVRILLLNVRHVIFFAEREASHFVLIIVFF